jgi:hypothetical protein
MRVDPLDHLAVELEHEPQHAVRGRMLRPEIDGEVAKRGFGHSDFGSVVEATIAISFCSTNLLTYSVGTVADIRRVATGIGIVPFARKTAGFAPATDASACD